MMTHIFVSSSMCYVARSTLVVLTNVAVYEFPPATTSSVGFENKRRALTDIHSISYDRDDTSLLTIHWFTGTSKAKSGFAMVIIPIRHS